jgi:hypothetical protein
LTIKIVPILTGEKEAMGLLTKGDDEDSDMDSLDPILKT